MKVQKKPTNAESQGTAEPFAFTWKPHTERNNTKGELITIKDHEVIDGKLGCCFSSWCSGICPNKMAGYKVFWLLQ